MSAAGNQPEDGERRVAAADRRLAGEDGPEAALARERLELRARVGDRHERSPRAAGALPEEVEVATGLERRPRLRGDEEERASGRALLERADRGGMRRVEDVEAAPPRTSPQDLRREARAAHPEEHDAASNSWPAARRTPRARPRARAYAAARRASRASGLVRARPERRVARPDALDELGGRRRRSRSALRPRRARPDFARMPSSSSSKESANFSTPSRSSVSVTSS